MAERYDIDYLTGLYNRKGLYEYFEKVHNVKYMNFIFLDLDNFKTINDVYGHQAGDEVLINFAKCLKECAPDAFIVRMGGDEFILVLEGEKTRSELTNLAEYIIWTLKKNRSQVRYLTMISVSIGIVWNCKDTKDIEHMLANSDVAMYQAKQSGKSCYVFYNDIEEQLLKEKEMEDASASALENGEFQLRFTPCINLQSSRLQKTQLLAVWMKNEQVAWEQEAYRPVFERNGFIRNLDLYLFEELCKHIKWVHQTFQFRVNVRIELSKLVFLEDFMVERLLHIIDKYGIESQYLDIGIDEGAFEHRDAQKIIDTMNTLREQGFALTLLSFGSNFASFKYLAQLPISALQFERHYIKENVKTHQGRMVLRSLIKLAKSLKLMVSAEGITDQTEITFLRSAGCDAAEGSVYTKPLTAQEYIAYVDKFLLVKDVYVRYPFKDNLYSEDGDFEGRIQGDNITFTKGITDKWGALHFPGGKIGMNVVHLPSNLFASNSYTISFWVKSEKIVPWGSVVFARYLAGFASMILSDGFGVSIFRNSDDTNVDVWHDVVCRMIPLNQWCMITLTYDSYGEVARYYINGRLAGYREKVPTMLACRQVVLGGDPFQPSFEGYLSAFMRSETVMTEGEVKELYASFVNDESFCGQVEDYWMDMEN